MARKLLLADDSITIQKVIEIVLTGEGFVIRAANNGEEAFAALSSFKPDIVLADVEMPVMNGYQLCERIRTDPVTSGIPVILLAGAFEPFDEGLAKRVGAYDYIVKPFESQELISKINAALTTKEILEKPRMEVETAGLEEEILTMEEVLSEPVGEETAVAEELIGEDIGLGKEIEFANEFLEAEEAGEAIGEAILVSEEKEARIPSMPQFEVPSREEFANIFKETVKEKISLLPPVIPTIEFPSKEGLEDIIKKTVEEMISSVSSLVRQIEIPSKEEFADILRKAVEEIISSAPPVVPKIETPSIDIPSKEELADIFKKEVGEKASSLLADLNIKDLLLSSLTIQIKDSAEMFIREITPEVVERLVKETLQSASVSLSREVEKVIWETVPGLAETIITREIEKIKSET